MTIARSLAPLLLLSALASACGPRVAPPAPPPASIDALLDHPPLSAVHFGMLVFDPSTGDTLYRRNPARHFAPASNQKLLSTSAAILRLGPDYHFVTELRGPAAGPDANGVLDGDLVLPGHGDPTLSDRFWPDAQAPLRALADSLLAAGVHTVRGRLVVDVSRWDSATVRTTWMVDDLPYRYASTGGAFVLAEGETTVFVTGTTPGRPAEVRWSPLGDDDFVRSEVLTVPAGDSARVRVSYLPESRRLHLVGEVEAGAVDTLHLATRDPVGQSSRALLRALEASGIRIEGGLHVAWDAGEPLQGGCRTGAMESCMGMRPLATLTSPPLMDIVAALLKPSQNWMTEQLVHHLGEVETGHASWPDGLDVVRSMMRDSLGLDTLDLHLVDGSGLSAYDLVTPRALGRLLAGVRARPWGAAYRQALAQPAEEESTLEHRLEDLGGRVQAKTGTITHVNSLSGYLTTVSGRELVFVLLSNGSGLPSRRVRDALDRIVEALAAERPVTLP
jgi:D-alanyl-D-alanine carboxypeptidase/D-alanyl-D-alanine-endopeptidase (penicillin-binding protein 4)